MPSGGPHNGAIRSLVEESNLEGVLPEGTADGTRRGGGHKEGMGKLMLEMMGWDTRCRATEGRVCLRPYSRGPPTFPPCPSPPEAAPGHRRVGWASSAAAWPWLSSGPGTTRALRGHYEGTTRALRGH